MDNFFGGVSHDVCYEVLETSQGNYMATGFYTGGDTLWTKIYAGEGEEAAF